jgi:hypothetical protein
VRLSRTTLRFPFSFSPWVALCTAASAFAACATPAGQGSDFNSGSSSNVLGSSSNGSSVGIPTTSGTFSGDLDASVVNTMPDAGRGKRCDDAGHCNCINIASIGHEGVWGACSSDTTTAFQDWLNTQSTAKVDRFDTAKPTINADFLANYDVLVLQWMVTNGQKSNDGDPWQFTAVEVSALQDWVNAGGGIVALNGYQGTDPTQVHDIFATNQLLSFTDIKFNQVVDVTQAANMGYCWGNAGLLGGPTGDSGVVGTGTWDPSSPIGANIQEVGALDVRSITATTATTDLSAGANKYAVHEQIGMGHVVAYGDEWVTYSGEWNGMADAGGSACIQPSFYQPSDPCYNYTPQRFLQVPQFWFNAIKYAASSVTCFDIVSPGIVR